MMMPPSAEAPVRRPLLRFVQAIEVMRPPSDDRDRFIDLLPDGTTSLVFRWLEGGVTDVSVLGPRTAAKYKVAPPIVLAVAIVFRPGGAYPFFGVPIDDLADLIVPLGSLWGRGGVVLVERLHAAATRGGDVAELAMAALGDRLRIAPFEPPSAIAARAAVDLLSRGDRSVDAVAEELGLSTRHLRRSFEATVGLAPKTFARIARFQRALALGRAAPGRWSAVARSTGYFDQAHLTGEFQRLARVTPGALELSAPRARVRDACVATDALHASRGPLREAPARRRPKSAACSR
jgi:AraC-like DNA-binding protein